MTGWRDGFRFSTPAPDTTVLEVVVSPGMTSNSGPAQPTDPLSPHLCVRVFDSQASFGAKRCLYLD